MISIVPNVILGLEILFGIMYGIVHGKGGPMERIPYTRHRVKNLDPDYSGSTRAKSAKWQLVIERDVPNPEYMPKADALDALGRDTRTSRQKRKSRPEQKTRMYKGEPVTEAKARAAALEWMKAVNAELAKPEGASLYVPEYVSQFIKHWTVEPSTMKGYRTAAKHIEAAFDGVPLGELDGRRINTWLAKLEKAGYSSSTRGKDFRLLSLVCKHAVIDGDLPANPCATVKPPKRYKGEPNSLVKPHREKLARMLEDMEPTPIATAATLALYMGLREGEICALRWRNVDLKRGKLTITEGIGRATGGSYVKRPKNEGSRRPLSIPEPAAAALAKRAERMHADLAAAGMELDPLAFGELYVVGHIDGRYKDPNSIGREWRAISGALGLMGTEGRPCTFHDLRHTFATVAVAEHIDIKTVASFMGHANAAMTLNIYASADDDAIAAAADVMAEAYGTRDGEGGNDER